MKRILRFLICAVCVKAETVSAQTNNLWTAKNQSTSSYSQSAYYFDASKNLKFIPSLNQQITDSFQTNWQVTLSGWSGSVQISSNSNNLFFNGVPIGNSNVSQPENDDPNSEYIPRPSLAIAPCDTSNFVLLTPYTKNFGLSYFSDTGRGFVSYIFIKQDPSHSTGYSIPVGAVSKRVTFPNQTVHSCALTRDKMGELVMIIRTTNNLYSYKWNDGNEEFLPLDSIHVPFLLLSPNPQYLDQDEFTISKFVTYRSPFISAKGDKVALESSYEISTRIGSRVVEFVSTVFEFDFDANTGKFTNNKPLYQTKWDITQPYPSGKFMAITFVEYSPDGSQIYLAGYEYEINDNIKLPIANSRYSQKPYCNYIETKLIQIDKLGQNRKDVFSSQQVGFESMHLNYHGELIISERVGQISRVKKSNLAYPACSFSPNTDQLPFGSQAVGPFHMMYDYNRVSHQTNYSCLAEVRFSNNPDPSINFTSFKWHFTKEDGTEFISLDKNPTISYSKSGDYPYKLFSQSTDGNGYGEWYIDTLKIRIPEKPVASFHASDTIVCSYTKLNFLNTSSSQDTLLNQYTWHFGDGITSNLKEPAHTYTSSGVYTVSLFYSNGYCDSTLVRNQYIQVVDAPKPGITYSPVDDGCAPLDFTVADTQKLAVLKKQYYFSDLAVWNEFNQDTIKHRFELPGDFLVIERLIGYNACETIDTAFIHVKAGLTDSDSFSIYNATILSENTSQIYWTSNAAAVEYEVYKVNNGSQPQFWTLTSDTFIVDSKYSSDDAYFVNGIDSCGNRGVQYLKGKPIVLSGEVVGINEFAELQFTPYESWPVGFDYELQKWNGQAWKAINTLSSALEYRDYNFSADDTLSACYRVISYHPMDKNTLTISNVFCLNLLPQIWVPNAFSPNQDNLNESFYPVMLGVVNFEMAIYNQWGQLVFNQQNTPWDGTFSGEPAPSGVYFVVYSVLTMDGKVNDKRVIHLVR